MSTYFLIFVLFYSVVVTFCVIRVNDPRHDRKLLSDFEDKLVRDLAERYTLKFECFTEEQL